MLYLLYSLIYIVCFYQMKIDSNYFVVLGFILLGLLRLTKDKKINFLGFIYIFDTHVSLENGVSLLGCLLFVGYFFIIRGYFDTMQAIITFPSLLIFFYYMIYYEVPK